MSTVSIDEAEGRVLADAVRSEAGAKLLSPGAQLTAARVAGLRRSGIVSVEVRETVDATVRQEDIRADVDHRFEGHEGDALMMELKRIVMPDGGSEDDAR